MKIAVFCASANEIDDLFKKEAQALGKKIGESGWDLIYGGTNIGLMKIVAETTAQYGGRVIGIIPKCIFQRGIAAEGLDQLFVVADMKERKHSMREYADAFIALPGGWGTLEEITEVITLKQLGEHTKPIIFLNTGGFYDTFLKFIGQLREMNFISSAYDRLYEVVNSAEEAVAYIRDYQELPVKSKYEEK